LDGFEEKTSGSLNFRNPSSSGRSEDAPSVEAMGGLTKPNTNFHPTVKPIKLMQYLARLITPPNGIVLDPFCGSGTTGIACKLEGFEFVGMEQDPEYTKIAQARIENYKEGKEIKQRETKKDATPNELINQLNLF
jgi:site-specific DNA-methyltransferase (adenine-specific)